MIRLIYESNSQNVFNLSNPGRYVIDYLDTEKVGHVSSHDYYKFEKHRDGNIVYMTANEYIDRCARDIFNMSVEDTLLPVDYAKVDRYAEAMRSGETFPICYLDYIYKQQEGRHRALAFEKAFGSDTKFPVLVITESTATLQEIKDYCDRRWKNYSDSFFPDIAESFGYSEKEINDFLGIDYNDEEDYQDDFDVSWDDIDIDDEVNLD